jgi:hypothetical protein
MKKAEISRGTYLHYKGNRYEVLGEVTHSETMEKLVLYKALYGEQGLWVRPTAMFLETVTVEGREVPRFSYMGTPSPQTSCP